MAREIKQAYYKAIGHSSHDVTGSCHLIRFKKYTILLDYGMYQTNDTLSDYKVNRNRHKDIKPKDIDYIFLSHIHADHCGLLPMLYKDGCTAPIIISNNSVQLLRLMLMDSVNIMERDCERYNKRHDVSMTPLYGKQDVDTTLKYVRPFEPGEKFRLNDDISFKLYSANHIVGAVQMLIEINDNQRLRKIGYTGDIGSPKHRKLYIDEFEPLEQVDLLIGECTYSGATRVHKKKDRAKDIEKIKTIVSQCVNNHKKVLFPVFSLNRLEDVLSVIYDIYHDKKLKVPVVIDTPLGNSIASIWGNVIRNDVDYWRKVWSWERIMIADTYKESAAWQSIDEPMIILSSGGMLTAGRAVGWAQKLLPSQNNHIALCGFTSEKSLASQIKNFKEYPTVKIDGKQVKNNAQVSILNSFSSHADHDELIEYYSKVRYDKIALVHSEESSKISFGKELKEKLSKENRTSRVIVVNQDTKVII